MANSQRISDLDQYPSVAELRGEDMIIVSSTATSNGGTSTQLVSYRMSFEQLYKLIKDKIVAELGNEWKNPGIIRSLAAALTTSDGANMCLGAEVAKDLNTAITKIRNEDVFKAKWS